MKVRLLLVDDHTMFREALRSMLNQVPGMEVVGELGNGALIEATVDRLKPDVVVMDVSMPAVNGMDATRRLLARNPAPRVVALSAHGYRQFILEMMEAGALAYVVKSAAADQLVHAISSVMLGRTYLCPESAAMLAQAPPRGQPGAAGERGKKPLGRREVEVLRLLTQGKTSPQIGQELYIAPSTVDVHRRNIMNKLELRSIAELTKYAIRTGLTDM